MIDVVNFHTKIIRLLLSFLLLECSFFVCNTFGGFYFLGALHHTTSGRLPETLSKSVVQAAFALKCREDAYRTVRTTYGPIGLTCYYSLNLREAGERATV